MIKALFFDIDGTLVSFNTHSIPASTVAALETAKKNGTEIYISTGRPYPLINNLQQIEHLIDGYITTNGAYCFIGYDVISCSPIPEDEVMFIIGKSKEAGFPCMVVGEKQLTMFNTASDPQKVRHISRLLNVPGIEKELPVEDVLKGNILQLTPFISEQQESDLFSSLKEIESGRWCPDFADITAKGVSKAKGLREIAAFRGFDVSAETMAFGDGGNDLSIIRLAGVGVAMGNANEILKKSADYVTDNIDDNGVSNALKHFGII